MEEKNFRVLSPNFSLSLPSKKKLMLKSSVSLGEKIILVSVWALESVKLMDGLLGNCLPCFPQYLTMAMFEGQIQETLPSVKL